MAAGGRHEDEDSEEGGVDKKESLRKKNPPVKSDGLKSFACGAGGLSVFAAQALGLPGSSFQEENEEEQGQHADMKCSPGWKRTDLQLRGQPLVVREVLAREEAQELAKKAGGIL